MLSRESLHLERLIIAPRWFKAITQGENYGKGMVAVHPNEATPEQKYQTVWGTC